MTRRAVALILLLGIALLGYLYIRGRGVTVRRINASVAAVPNCALQLVGSTGDDIVVRLSISNPTREPLGVDSWALPAWGHISSPLFNVQRDGKTVGYNGSIGERKNSFPDVYDIAPGREASTRVSLSDAHYAVSGHGEFTIIYRGLIWAGGKSVLCTSVPLLVDK